MASDLATVDSLPGLPWNAHAALGDALQRAPIGAPLIVLWLDELGQLHYSRSATNKDTVWMVHNVLTEHLNTPPDESC